MKRVFLGAFCLMLPLAMAAPAALAALPNPRSKTIRDLSGTLPLELFQRSVTKKFYQSLLVSPLEDWSVVRAQTAGRRAGTHVIRPAANPTYDALAVKFANELPLLANDRSRSAEQRDSALLHLLIYKIADGVMAVSFTYSEVSVARQIKNVGTVRLSVRTNEGPWTEIKAPETGEDRPWSLRERGRKLRRMDRMPMDAISISRP
jgi:hypothetical protein